MISPRIPFVLFLALPLCASVHAAAGKTSAGTFGTRDQLRECLTLDDTLKGRSQALEAGVVAHNKRMDDNDAEDARLVEMKKALDRTDKTAIVKFNALVMTHKQHVDEANQEGVDLDKVSQAYKDDKADADQKCGALTYRPADVDAVSRERKKAAAVAAAASAP